MFYNKLEYIKMKFFLVKKKFLSLKFLNNLPILKYSSINGSGVL